jgi:predicted DNA-binding transcriptional regulator YafY
MNAYEIYRRASARRRYNKQRQADRLFRRLIINARMHADPNCGRRGWCADLAREFGVSRATISRDVWALLDGRL